MQRYLWEHAKRLTGRDQDDDNVSLCDIHDILDEHRNNNTSASDTTDENPDVTQHQTYSSKETKKLPNITYIINYIKKSVPYYLAGNIFEHFPNKIINF